jgi:hypothetical protein
MAANRRQFIKRSGLLFGGAAVLHGIGSATAAPASRLARPAASPLTALLTRCRVKAAWLTGGSVLGTSFTPACISIAAVVGDPVAVFSRLLGDMPFPRAWVDGNTLLLEDQSVYYKINFYDRPAWNALRTRLAAGEGIRFAHQALLRDRTDAAAPVSDPFSVMASGGRTLRMVGSADSTPLGRLRSVLEGCTEAALYSLTPSPAFTALRTAVLERQPADDAEARSVVDEFTAATALLAATCGSAEMTALLGSPLISASMHRVFGRSGPEIVSAAGSLPASADSVPGAPWLAGILGSGNLTVPGGSVSIEHEDRYSSLQARKALLQARAASTSAF